MVHRLFNANKITNQQNKNSNIKDGYKRKEKMDKRQRNKASDIFDIIPRKR